MAPSASAWLSVSAPAIVTGAIAPIRQNGVTMQGWPLSAKSIRPCAIGMSIWRGELVLMTVVHQASALNCSGVRPRAMRNIAKPSIVWGLPRA